jgi:hypothetical protein
VNKNIVPAALKGFALAVAITPNRAQHPWQSDHDHGDQPAQQRPGSRGDSFISKVGPSRHIFGDFNEKTIHFQ